MALDAELMIACLNEPAPESLVVLTVRFVPGRVVNEKSAVVFVPAGFHATTRKLGKAC